MALKYLNIAYNFIAAFRKANKHAIILHQKLHEVNLLMRDLQQYMDRNRQSSNAGLGQDKPLHQSVIEIAKQFADDMICLHELLPYDMDAFSASIRKRTKFVIKEKEAAQILARLEDRKSAATLALALVGRLEEEFMQSSVASLHGQAQQLALQQDVLHTNLTQNHEELSIQLSVQNSHTVAAMKEIRELVASNGSAAARQQHAFAEGVARSIADVQTQVTTILAQQNSMLALKSWQVAKADVVANDSDALSRLVRAELRRQLEPLLNQFDNASEHIDRVAMAFASETVAKGLFETGETPSKSESTDISTQTKRKQPQALLQQAVPSAPRQVSPAKDAKAGQPQKVFLSCCTHRICSRLGNISVILRTYRLRRAGSNNRDTYFELRAHIIPSASLYSRGLSALYSSGPDCCGYFSITPQISLVNTIADGAEIYDVILNDDVRRFRMLLEEGKFGIWDLHCGGFSLIEWSVTSIAPLICQYLLRDSGYGAQLIERNGLTMSWLSAELAYCIVATEPVLAEDVLTHFKRLTSESIEEDEDRLYSYAWVIFYEAVKDAYEDAQSQRAAAILYGSVLINAGFKLRPFDWDTHDIELTVFLMGIYIASGGDANGRTPEREPILYAALTAIACLLGQDPSEGGICISSDTRYRASDHAQRKLCGLLVRMLIEAGAALMFHTDSHQLAFCACCLAYQLGIDDIWEHALEGCGWDPSIVQAGIHRCATKVRRLHYADRTGVDVVPVTEQLCTSGLRRRKASRRSIEEMEA